MTTHCVRRQYQLAWLSTGLQADPVASGPFDISAKAIESLGDRFASFVNDLLQKETVSAGLAVRNLTITYQEKTPDGGVDAGLRDADATEWLPEGDSAWQFKSSDIGPARCERELAGAEWAHGILRDGGTYVMVIAKTYNDKLHAARLKKLRETAIELGLIGTADEDRIRVYGADHIAQWASRYPSFATSHYVHGSGPLAESFDQWSASSGHQSTWQPDQSRLQAIDTIRSEVSLHGPNEIRVEGGAGIGKTRLVMEALRDDVLKPLVAYVADEDAMDSGFWGYLQDEKREAILVIDECPPGRHIKLSNRIREDQSGLRLVTIGEPGPADTKRPVVALQRLCEEKLREYLSVDYRELTAEAQRFVVDHCAGNIRWAQRLTERIKGIEVGQAADLIAQDDINALITGMLPEGRDFFNSAVLALLQRVGWDREVRGELETLARFAGISVNELEGAGQELGHRGLLARRGRYRAVSPHPLAVFLAAEAWREVGDRIVTDLIPDLDEQMGLAFFQRVADLGQFEPAQSVLTDLLGEEGPFASLEQIESRGTARQLTPLGIVMPSRMADHLHSLISATSLTDLRSQSNSRRDLVWTLEKLAWHRETFDTAADDLLRLALAENETFANNATGAWVGLFGSMLPATAADPDQRITYLERVAAEGNKDVQCLVAQACARALSNSEVTSVSAELQGGALVEKRGSARTQDELTRFRETVVTILNNICTSADAEVAKIGQSTMIDLMHAMMRDPFAREHYSETVTKFEGTARERIRTEAVKILNLHRGLSDPDRRIIEAIDALMARLPEASNLETFRSLVRHRQWDLEGDFQQQIGDAVAAFESSENLLEALGILKAYDVGAAWEVGHALAKLEDMDDLILPLLVTSYSKNPTALVGYLRGQVEIGNTQAFDDFITSVQGGDLDLRARVAISVAGPLTQQAQSLIRDGLRELPVSEAVTVSFHWARDQDADEICAIVDDWLDRICNSTDYAAVVDWFNFWLHKKDGVPEPMSGLAWRLVGLRATHPDIGQKQWDWGRIAERYVSDHHREIADLILDLMDLDGLLVHHPDDNTKLLIECAKLDPEYVWMSLVRRIEHGSWRVPMTVRGWLILCMPHELVERWIVDDVEKARLVASIASIGGNKPTPVARHLLDNFGDDETVRSELWSEFMSGSWMGPESSHISRQIADLEKWIQSKTEPAGVKRWAHKMIEYLENSRKQALEAEAESQY